MLILPVLQLSCYEKDAFIWSDKRQHSFDSLKRHVKYPSFCIIPFLKPLPHTNRCFWSFNWCRIITSKSSLDYFGKKLPQNFRILQNMYENPMPLPQ